MSFEVIPAIDLRGGHCVRLYQGDYSRETVFSEKPVEMALRWQAEGAPRLHIVDLDGAEQGEPRNLGPIQDILASVRIPVQVGGGIRRLKAIEEVLGIGVERVVLGSVAVEDPVLVAEVCRRYGEAIVVSIDASGGYVLTHGWQQRSQKTAVALLEEMEELGVRRFIYTDIARDGTLTEPNFDAIAELVARGRTPIIASGGISSLEHLRRLATMRLEGAILGMALYTGQVDLKEALAVVG